MHMISKTMKLTLGSVTSAALISMSCMTGHAADMVYEDYGSPTRVSFGEIEARAGGIWLDGNELDDGEDEQMLFAGAALRAGTVFENRWIIQGDLFGELTDSNENDSYAFGVGAAAHIARRFDAYLLGVFGGYLHTDQDTGDDDTSGRVFAGIEAQRYYDNVTLYGQAGWLGGDWGDDDDGKDSLSRAVFARAMIRYFVNSATRLDLSAAGFYGEMDDDFEDFTRGGSLTVGIEHQLHDGPFSVFSGYEFGYFHQNEDQNTADEEIMEHTVSAGLKYRFGVDGTLKQQDRDRPSLDLPPLLRWVAQTGGPLE